MKVNSVQYNRISPLFKGESVVPYPELYCRYQQSDLNASKADALSSDPLTALLNKFAKAFRLLFTPDVNKEAKNIQNGIDALFEGSNIGNNLDKVA